MEGKRKKTEEKTEKIKKKGERCERRVSCADSCVNDEKNFAELTGLISTKGSIRGKKI